MTAPKVYRDEVQVVAIYVTSKNHISSWLVVNPLPPAKKKNKTKQNLKQNETQKQNKKIQTKPTKQKTQNNNIPPSSAVALTQDILSMNPVGHSCPLPLMCALNFVFKWRDGPLLNI